MRQSNYPMRAVESKAKNIKLLVLDVDGVLTDGKLFFSAQGNELKAFSILDGLGIKMLKNSGVDIGIITGRTSPLVARRVRDLGIEHLLQGREDKLVALRELTSELNISLGETAYMGDDLPDLSAIRSVELGITVPNAHDFVLKHADHCTIKAGGDGAVREICDFIMKTQGTLEAALNKYLD